MRYVGIMGMTRAVWVGQERVSVGHCLPGLIARTASAVFAVMLLTTAGRMLYLTVVGGKPFGTGVIRIIVLHRLELIVAVNGTAK